MNIFKLLIWLALLPTFANAADYSVIRQYVYPVLISSVEAGALSGKSEVVVGSGSAVSVQSGYMITAAHVVPTNAANKMYVMRGDQLVRAVPIKIDRGLDLALLSVAIPCPCAPLAGPERIEVDSPIFTVGFPMYMTYGVQIVSQGNIQGNFQNNIVSTSVTAPGGSGGGLFTKLETQYKLIGITVAIATSPIGPRVMNLEQEHNWVSFSIPMSNIRTFLRGTQVKVD
jgi:S1-C subfamily serine protease